MVDERADAVVVGSGFGGSVWLTGYFFGDQPWQVYARPVRHAAPQAWLRKAAR